MRLTRYGTAAPPLSASDPLTFSGFDAAGEPVPHGAFGSYVTLVVRTAATGAGPVLPGIPRSCSSGYRLSLTAIGRRGVDPITGAKVPF